jgi:deoxycytidine triphosphate deaminase
MTLDFSKFATDDTDAAQRAARHAAEDPLPSVPCSLLSSAEIHDYARITGMLHPFFPDRLKSASYEAHVGGALIRWDEHGRKHERKIVRGDPCKLPPNSITFVQIEPKFQLPNYMAIRFNLRITHVHRGLLLGTGPLVDPGFHGKLLVPLHNLTSSEYDLDTNEALIWIEFTKTTYGHQPKDALASPERHFRKFEGRKNELTPDQYLRKASGGYPIQSSIPSAIEQGKNAAEAAERLAKDAAATATSLRDRTFQLGLSALAALALALVGIYFQVSGMVQSSINLSTSVEHGLAPLTADGKITSDKITAAQAEIIRLRQQLDELGAEIDKLKQLNQAAQPRTQPSQKTHP